MSEQPEPLAAILADYRADIPAMTSGELPHPTPEYLRILLDRIEAAAARERDEDRQLAAIAESDEAFARCARCDRPERTPGNAAAMRAAMENIERVARFCAEMPRHTPGYPTDAARADVLYSRIVELGRVARAALSAPARNCDRPFRVFEEAIGAYVAERGDGPHLGYCDAIKWALAPAEGGAK